MFLPSLGPTIKYHTINLKFHKGGNTVRENYLLIGLTETDDHPGSCPISGLNKSQALPTLSFQSPLIFWLIFFAHNFLKKNPVPFMLSTRLPFCFYLSPRSYLWERSLFFSTFIVERDRKSESFWDTTARLFFYSGWHLHPRVTTERRFLAGIGAERKTTLTRARSL